jgi:anaerobic selenocysteine-containing dehydrogenase
MQVHQYQNDPDRLLYPLRRSTRGWERIAWDTATREIGAKLRALRKAYGPNAIATYWGNACDSLTITLANTLCSAFGSPNSFNVLSLEYTDRGVVAARVLGNENLILQPDAANAEFALLLGTNPLVTQGMTLLQRRPRIIGDFRQIQGRGGKVVVVDPRVTETAKVADEHIAIRPGTDLFLLVALLKRIIETEAYDAAFITRHVNGLDLWRQLVAHLSYERAAAITDVPVVTLHRLADQFAAADGAFATTRVGVQTSHNCSLTEWAVLTLNTITGNIDRPGGVYFNPGAVDVPRLIEQFTAFRNPAPSRIGKYPQIFGGPPASVFADDVLSDDPNRIRALVVVGGNPVITFPNTPKVEAALRRLDLLVCIDLYLSDTGSFAHYNLPAATMFEKGTFHFLTSTFEPYPYAEWKPKVVEPRGKARSEWDIFKALARGAGVPFLNLRLLDGIDRLLSIVGSGLTPDLFFQFLLLGKTSLRRLKQTQGGIKFGDIQWGAFLRSGLYTKDKRIHLAPDDFAAALPSVLVNPPLPTDDFPLLLISGGRRLASYNSWTHNIPALMDKLKGNHAVMNVDDGEKLGLQTGDIIRVISATSSLEIAVEITDVIRAGVIMIHQFWGHVYESGMTLARQYPGVNVNHLHNDQRLDLFSGMPVFNGTPCRVERVAGPDRRLEVAHNASAVAG